MKTTSKIRRKTLKTSKSLKKGFTTEDIKDMSNIEHLKPEIPWLESVTFAPEVTKQSSGARYLIPAFWLKFRKNFVIRCVFYLQSRWVREVFPQKWKCANVTPILKKGSKLNPGKYKPVSLTCILCKITESVIRDSLVEHFTKNNLISNSQHGFFGQKIMFNQFASVF